MTTPPLSLDDLMAFADGTLNPADRPRVEQVLADSPADRQRLAEIRRILETPRVARPPSEWTERVAALVEAPEPVGPDWWDSLQRVVASLLFDSRATPAVAGFRASQLDAQLTFDSPLGPIDLELQEPTPGRPNWTLLGAIALHEPGTVWVRIRGEQGVVAEAPSDGAGSFHFDLPAGEYFLELATPAARVELPKLLVG